MKNLYRTALPLIVAAVMLVSVLCVGGIGATAAVTDTFVDEIVEGFNYDPDNGPVVFYTTEGSQDVGASDHRLAYEYNYDLDATVMVKQDNDRNPNHTEYIVYKMDKNICGFELDAVVCAGVGDILDDLTVSLSKTGTEGSWVDVKTQATMYEYDEDIYLEWDMAYWFNTTVHNAQKIPVGYKYLKIQFNACNDTGDVPWNVAIDTVKIRMGTSDPVPVIPADKLLTQTWDEINASRDASRTTTNPTKTTTSPTKTTTSLTWTTTSPAGNTTNYYPTNSTTASITNPGTRPTNPAPDADAPAFAMDSVTALAGQTVTVPLRIVNNPGIIGMRAVVTYDPAVLTPTAMEAQDFAGATFGPLSNPLSVIWYDALSPDNTTDGVVALCTFTVAADAPAGEYPLLVSIADPDDIYNAAWETVAFTTMDGSVRVVDYVAGDANSDGKVNVRDLGLIQQYLNGWDVTLEHGSSNTTSTTLPIATTSTTTNDNIIEDDLFFGDDTTTTYTYTSAHTTTYTTRLTTTYNHSPHHHDSSFCAECGSACRRLRYGRQGSHHSAEVRDPQGERQAVRSDHLCKRLQGER